MDFLVLPILASGIPNKAGRLLLYAKATGLYAKIGAGSEFLLGIPAGGAAGQVLKKVDSADYNVNWANDLTGGGSGSVDWGAILGTLSDQSDLQAALDTKSDVGHTHTLSEVTDYTAPPTLDYGTYTPVLTNVANAPTLTAESCQYLRVGNTVTVSGSLVIDATTGGGTVTRVGISLPIASDLAGVNQCTGTGCLDSTGMAAVTTVFSVPIIGDATNNRAEMNALWYTSSSVRLYFHFTYRIN